MLSREDASSPTSRAPKVAPEVDAYLERVPLPARRTLEKIRKIIRVAAPEAHETITYRIPTFHHRGMLVGLGAAEKHCALYVMSAAVMKSLEDELVAYDTWKGTIRFPWNAPLRAALVKKVVEARLAENEWKASLRPTASPFDRERLPILTG